MLSISGLLLLSFILLLQISLFGRSGFQGLFLLVGEIFGLGLVCSVVSMKTVMVWRVVKGFDFGGKTCGVWDKRWSLCSCVRSFFHEAAEGSMQGGGGGVLLY
jgi:hypothetical protein